jgi:hypothetical protein
MRKEDFNSREDYNAAKQRQSNNKPLTLAEQLKELNKSPEQKRRETPWHEWCKDLFQYAHTEKGVSCSPRLYLYVSNKYKAEFENFHKKGTKFSEIIAFVNSKSNELRD